MWKVLHFLSRVIPAHRSGVAPSGINDFSAQEWVPPIIVGESEQMETTNCMFMLTSISIWVTSILYFGSQHSVGKRPVYIRGGRAEQCRLVKNCFFSAVAACWHLLQRWLKLPHLENHFLMFLQIVLQLLFGLRVSGIFEIAFLCDHNGGKVRKTNVKTCWPCLDHQQFLYHPPNIYNALNWWTCYVIFNVPASSTSSI